MNANDAWMRSQAGAKEAQSSKLEEALKRIRWSAMDGKTSRQIGDEYMTPFVIAALRQLGYGVKRGFLGTYYTISWGPK